MDAKEVGIQEFGADLAKYIGSSTPVAVVQDGQTVGYFIPVFRHDAADVAAFEKAGEAFDRALGAREIDIEEAVAEFDALRKNANHRKKTGSKAA
jgi:hypothetical protein